MASLTLKDIPEDVLEELRELAKRERRSLNRQALVLIEGGLERETGRMSARRQSQIKAIRELAGSWQSDLTFEEEVAEIYAARTGGRKVEL